LQIQRIRGLNGVVGTRQCRVPTGIDRYAPYN